MPFFAILYHYLAKFHQYIEESKIGYAAFRIEIQTVLTIACILDVGRFGAQIMDVSKTVLLLTKTATL